MSSGIHKYVVVVDQEIKYLLRRCDGYKRNNVCVLWAERYGGISKISPYKSGGLWATMEGLRSGGGVYRKPKLLRAFPFAYYSLELRLTLYLLSENPEPPNIERVRKRSEIAHALQPGTRKATESSPGKVGYQTNLVPRVIKEVPTLSRLISSQNESLRAMRDRRRPLSILGTTSYPI